MIKKIIILVITVAVMTALLIMGLFKILPKEDIIIDNKPIEPESSMTGSINENKSQSGSVEIKSVTKNEQLVREKIMKLRKRFEVKGIIIAGDIYSRKANYETALEKYMEALEKAQGDEKILKKIGDTYFELKEFSSAYEYYEKIKELKNYNKEQSVLSLIYSKEINAKSIGKIISEIKGLGLKQEEEFYFVTGVNCIKSFHECKKTFQTYFETNTELTYDPLIDIKESINNYENFQVEEIYYKNALIIGSLFTHKMYPIAISLGKNLLIEKKDYKPVLQIIGKSYYELGKYDKSKTFLAKYYEQEKEDSSVMYLLGVIDLEVGEYLVSNILLKEAIDYGYENKADARRMIIYNYYMLGRIDKVLESFKFLLEEEGLTKHDFRLAIYYHIINGENDYARKVILDQIKIDPKDNLMYTYLGWIEKEEGNLEEAKNNFNKAMEIDSRSPMTNFNYGLLEIEKGNKSKAFIYFKRTSKEDKLGEYGKQARIHLQELSSSTTGTGTVSEEK